MQLKDIKYLTPIILAFIISTAVSLTVGAIGVDIIFHYKIAAVWAAGQNGFFAPIALQVNGSPYPPLFHFILVPAVWLGIEAPYAAALQIFFYPLAVASSMFLAWKTLGKNYAMYIGFLVMGSYAFFDRSFQPIPQAIDFILLPLAMLYSIQYAMRYEMSNDRSHDKRYDIRYVITSSLMIWNHGIVSIASLGGTLLLKIKRRQYSPILVIAAATSIILALSIAYLIPALTTFGSRSSNLQQTEFWQSPLTFTILYQRLPFLGFIVAAYILYQSYRKHTGLSELQKTCLLTIATMSLMIPLWADRWVQFTTIPLSLLIIEHMKTTKPQYRDAWLIGIMFAFLFFYYTLVIWLLGGFFQPAFNPQI